jgi:hypothetical protein
MRRFRRGGKGTGIVSPVMLGVMSSLGLGGTAWGQTVEVTSTVSVMSASVNGLVCPIECSAALAAWGSVRLDKFDTTLGPLVGVEVRVTAVAGGVFEWTAADVLDGGSYVVETPLEARASVPGITTLAGFFWVEECSREIGPSDAWGRCDLWPSLGESAWRTVPTASRGLFAGAGSLEVPVSARFYPIVTIVGVPWFTWSERLQVEVQVQARYRYCSADFNRDGFVDFFDYDSFIACYEAVECPEGLSADYNRDGYVDPFDIYAFDAVYLAGCPGL